VPRKGLFWIEAKVKEEFRKRLPILPCSCRLAGSRRFQAA
jgi:hypothetical protein